MKFKLAAASLAMVLASACAKENQQQEPGPVIQETPVRSELLGTWQSNCIEGQNYALTSKADLGITQRSQITVDDSKITEVSTVSSLSCDSKDIEITSIGARDSQPAQGEGIHALSAKVASYHVKPLSEFGVRVLNLSKWCGFDDWAVDQDKDVTSAIGKDKCFTIKAVNTVYSIEGSNLYFGNTNQVSSSSDTPTDLKKTFYFTRL